MLRLKGVAAIDRVLFLSALAGLLSASVPVLFSAQIADRVPSEAVPATAAAIALSYSLFRYSRGKNTQGIIAATGGSLFAFVYLGLLLGVAFFLRARFSAWVLLWVLMTTKSCDIGAYFTGKAMGKHKLILWLSPGKTWEGLFGGMLFASLIGALGIWLLEGRVPGPWPAYWAGAVAGALFGAIGQTGDLMKSLLKRDAGIKDSSHLFPGFGGILDLIDSPLLVMPVAYWWLWAATPASTGVH